MIEHHYTIIYNSTTGSWYLDTEDVAYPDGTIYSTTTGQFFFPDEENPEHDDILAHDLDGLSKVNDALEALNASSSTQGE
jgi:hypothetical protein